MPERSRGRGERALVVVGLLALCALGWLYLLDQARGMSAMRGGAGMEGMPGMGAMPGMAGMPEMGGGAETWGLRDLGYLAVMWSVMMAAMMLPSATPTVLLVDRMLRVRQERSADVRAAAWRAVPLGTATFVLGYLGVWALYSLVAASAQWLLHRALLVSPAMVSASPVLSGSLLVAAGLYQLTPFKDACLAHCRSPLSFVSTHWREGRWGPLLMGGRHGSYCVGCCWALMALLFVLGVMNLLWVLALAALVLAEKTLPGSRWITRGGGTALLAWGTWMLVTAARGG